MASYFRNSDHELSKISSIRMKKILSLASLCKAKAAEQTSKPALFPNKGMIYSLTHLTGLSHIWLPSVRRTLWPSPVCTTKTFYQQGLAYTIYQLGQGTFKNCVENLEDQHPRRPDKHNQCNRSPHGFQWLGYTWLSPKRPRFNSWCGSHIALCAIGIF